MQVLASFLPPFRLLDLPSELRLRIYEFAFAGSELIVRARVHPSLSPDNWWEGMTPWERAWYSFHEERPHNEDLDASRYPLALAQTTSRLRQEAQPTLAAATSLFAIGVHARVALSMIPPHIKRYTRSFTISGEAPAGLPRMPLIDDLDPFLPSDLPLLQSLTTHMQYGNKQIGFVLSQLAMEKYRSRKCLKKLKRRYTNPARLRTFIGCLKYPFVSLREMVEQVPFSIKLVAHFSGAWICRESDVTFDGCLHVSLDIRTGEILEVHAGGGLHDDLWNLVDGENSWARDHYHVV